VEFVPCVEFEVRNEGQRQNIIATGISMFLWFLLDSNDVSAAKACLKVTVTDAGDNNSEIWGQSPQPPEANGGCGAEPQRFGDFSFFFFQKIKHFSAYFGINFCFKACF